MINMTDPLLRKIVEDALKGGNTSLGRDLELGPLDIRRRPDLASAQMARVPDTIQNTNPLPGGTPPPRGPQPSILDRMLSGIFVPQAPSMHGYEKDRASRMFLSGLTGAVAKNHQGAGYGSGILGAIGGRNSGGGGAAHAPAVDPNADLKRAYLQAQIDAAKALGGTRNARTAEINQPDDKVDPFEEEKRKWWESRTDANTALAESRRKAKPAGKGGGRSSGASGGGKPLTMAQKRAQINSLASAEKQRVANNIKNKYRDVYDYNNPVSGTPEGKRIVDAAIARGIAQVEQEHARVLRNLGSEYGMDQGENAPVKTTGKSTLDLLNEK